MHGQCVASCKRGRLSLLVQASARSGGVPPVCFTSAPWVWLDKCPEQVRGRGTRACGERLYGHADLVRARVPQLGERSANVPCRSPAACGCAQVRLLLAGKGVKPAECALHPGRIGCMVERLLEA